MTEPHVVACFNSLTQRHDAYDVDQAAAVLLQTSISEADLLWKVLQHSLTTTSPASVVIKTLDSLRALLQEPPQQRLESEKKHSDQHSDQHSDEHADEHADVLVNVLQAWQRDYHVVRSGLVLLAKVAAASPNSKSSLTRLGAVEVICSFLTRLQASSCDTSLNSAEYDLNLDSLNACTTEPQAGTHVEANNAEAKDTEAFEKNAPAAVHVAAWLAVGCMMLGNVGACGAFVRSGGAHLGLYYFKNFEAKQCLVVELVCNVLMQAWQTLSSMPSSMPSSIDACLEAHMLKDKLEEELTGEQVLNLMLQVLQRCYHLARLKLDKSKKNVCSPKLVPQHAKLSHIKGVACAMCKVLMLGCTSSSADKVIATLLPLLGVWASKLPTCFTIGEHKELVSVVCAVLAKVANESCVTLQLIHDMVCVLNSYCCRGPMQLVHDVCSVLSKVVSFIVQDENLDDACFAECRKKVTQSLSACLTFWCKAPQAYTKLDVLLDADQEDTLMDAMMSFACCTIDACKRAEARSLLESSSLCTSCSEPVSCLFATAQHTWNLKKFDTCTAALRALSSMLRTVKGCGEHDRLTCKQVQMLLDVFYTVCQEPACMQSKVAEACLDAINSATLQQLWTPAKAALDLVVKTFEQPCSTDFMLHTACQVAFNVWSDADLWQAEGLSLKPVSAAIWARTQRIASDAGLSVDSSSAAWQTKAQSLLNFIESSTKAEEQQSNLQQHASPTNQTITSTVTKQELVGRIDKLAQQVGCLNERINAFDTWMNRSLAGCQYHVAHPGGRNYATFPVNAYEAESRRLSRFFPMGHTAGKVDVPPPERSLEFPFTLDLRKAG